MTRQAVLVRILVGALVLMPISAVVFVAIGRERIVAARHGKLPILGDIQSFTLVEASGQPLGTRELAGKVWVAGFILTRCSGQCPIITHNMKLLQRALTPREDLKLVTFSVDPDFDTPTVLASYAERLELDRGGWWFLTGPKEDVHRVVREMFKLTVDENGTPEEPVIHSSKLVLVDRVGQIRGYYDGMDAETTKTLSRDIRRLLAARS